MSAERAPTPWRVDGWQAIIANNNEYVAEVLAPCRLANAEFIVRAANSHDELVAALRIGWRYVENELDIVNDERDIAEVEADLAIVALALAKAEGLS